jgi:ANTAR domain/GAF domain
MDTDESVLEASRRLSESLTPGDLDATLDRITAAAVEVIPDVELASITIKHADGRLETFAPTDDVLLDVDAAQYELQQGPCYEAAVDSVHVTAPHLAEDPRFPQYAPVAVGAGIQAQAGIRLFDARASNGALNLYGSRPGAFTDLGDLGPLFAHHAATALAYAREITQLQEALRTRQLIGQAVGMTMERFGLDDARAFGFLARLSQDNNVKLRVVAERMLAERDFRDPSA